jgi:hypothetical protein
MEISTIIGHSAVTRAMSCKHAIIDPRPESIAKFAGFGANFATGRTKLGQLKEDCHQMRL